MEVVTDGSTSPDDAIAEAANQLIELFQPLATVTCLLYTSPSPRDKRQSRMPSSA